MICSTVSLARMGTWHLSEQNMSNITFIFSHAEPQIHVKPKMCVVYLEACSLHLLNKLIKQVTVRSCDFFTCHSRNAEDHADG